MQARNHVGIKIFYQHQLTQLGQRTVRSAVRLGQGQVISILGATGVLRQAVIIYPVGQRRSQLRWQTQQRQQALELCHIGRAADTVTHNIVQVEQALPVFDCPNHLAIFNRYRRQAQRPHFFGMVGLAACAIIGQHGPGPVYAGRAQIARLGAVKLALDLALPQALLLGNVGSQRGGNGHNQQHHDYCYTLLASVIHLSGVFHCKANIRVIFSPLASTSSISTPAGNPVTWPAGGHCGSQLPPLSR